MFRKVLWLVCLVTLVTLISWADAWDKKTVLKLNEPIQVPGATLQPGKYVFKLVDSLSDRHIVRIMNEQENEVITTILAIPNYRLTPTGKSQFEFWETPAGNPKALRAWFYPGDNFGQEFAYPKGMSVKLAEYTHTNVPSTTAKEEAELSSRPVGPVDKPETAKPLVAEARRSSPPAAIPAATPAPEPMPAPAQVERRELPATASPLPALGLAALLAIAAGLALRRLTSAG